MGLVRRATNMHQYIGRAEIFLYLMRIFQYLNFQLFFKQLLVPVSFNLCLLLRKLADKVIILANLKVTGTLMQTLLQHYRYCIWREKNFKFSAKIAFG